MGIETPSSLLFFSLFFGPRDHVFDYVQLYFVWIQGISLRVRSLRREIVSIRFLYNISSIQIITCVLIS